MNNLSINELIKMIKELNINTEPIEYKRSNRKASIKKCDIKKNKHLLIKHIIASKKAEQKAEQKTEQKTEQKAEQKAEQKNYMYEWVANFITQREYRNDLYTSEQLQELQLHTDKRKIALELWNTFSTEQKLSLRVAN